MELLLLLLCLAGCAGLVYLLRPATPRSEGAAVDAVREVAPRGDSSGLVVLWVVGLLICAFVGYYPPHVWSSYRDEVGDWVVPAGLLVGALIGSASVLSVENSWRKVALCVVTWVIYSWVSWWVWFFTSLSHGFGNPG